MAEPGYIKSDKHHATSLELAMKRVAAIYKHRGITPDYSVLQRQAQSAVGNYLVFDQIRGAADTPKPPAAPKSPAAPTQPAIDYRKLARALYSWLPEQLLNIFTDAYVEYSGDANAALGIMRNHSLYEVYYPGNRRENGTIRYTEQDYARQIEGFRHNLRFYNLPEAAFKDKFGELIAGGVDAEAFGRRLDTVYVRVFQQGDQIRDAYARLYGNFSDAAIMGSAIRPELSPADLELMISRAEVAGAASESGFEIGLGEATRLQMAGLDLEAARNISRRARGVLPTLNELVQRHNDPDDEFDFMDYADAVVLSDPESLGRMRRLVQTEGAMFSRQQLGRMDQQGRIVGLRQS